MAGHTLLAMTFIVEISSLRGGRSPTWQSIYVWAASTQAVPFRANTVGGLLRHDVPRNDGGSEMNVLSSQKQGGAVQRHRESPKSVAIQGQEGRTNLLHII